MAVSMRDARNGQHRLVEALQGASLDPADGSEAIRELTRAADHHGIVIALYRAFQRGDISSPEGTALATLARSRRAGALRISVAAGEVSEWLGQAEVGHAVLKGPAVAAAYEDADREFVDLDVLVAPGQMGDAISTLEAHGARRLEGVPWPRLDGIGELTLGLPSGVALDLHADLVHRADVRRDFCLPVESLLDRATTARILARDIPVLDPEDTLIHVALHAVISGGDRLVWLADLDALIRRDQVSWPDLLRRAHEARTALVVGVMLDRASMVLGTPVPEEVLRALRRRGNAWALLLRLFERWRPTAESYGRSFHGQVLVRATRDTTARSVATLTRLIWTDVIRFVLSDPSHPWRSRLRARRG
jgi:putative nucleotidyltransferase-like protein